MIVLSTRNIGRNTALSSSSITAHLWKAKLLASGAAFLGGRFVVDAALLDVYLPRVLLPLLIRVAVEIAASRQKKQVGAPP